MASLFSIRTISRYERMARKLLEHHPELQDIQHSVREIFSTDPYNRSRQYHIKKLEDVRSGAGQYRLSLGRWRFRYDIFELEVILQYCGLRREDTYH